MERLKHRLNQARDEVVDLEHEIKSLIAQLDIDDHLETMSDFRDALDYIDLNMTDNEILRHHVQHWRLLYGQWKKHLSSDISSIAYFHHAVARTDTPRTHALQNLNTIELGQLLPEVKALSKRAVLTFTAIMATMSIIESQEAIAQAKIVSKLTNLAFFFIPLTLSASVFGMNIAVSKPSLDLEARCALVRANDITRSGRTAYIPGSGS